jgi:hypothetical protein
MTLDPDTAAIAAALGYDELTAEEAAEAFPAAAFTHLLDRPADSLEAALHDVPVGWPLIHWHQRWWPVPNLGQVEKWALGDIAFNPEGEQVEPDAPDSWLSILGLI